MRLSVTVSLFSFFFFRQANQCNGKVIGRPKKQTSMTEIFASLNVFSSYKTGVTGDAGHHRIAKIAQIFPSALYGVRDMRSEIVEAKIVIHLRWHMWRPAAVVFYFEQIQPKGVFYERSRDKVVYELVNSVVF